MFASDDAASISAMKKWKAIPMPKSFTDSTEGTLYKYTQQIVMYPHRAVCIGSTYTSSRRWEEEHKLRAQSQPWWFENIFKYALCKFHISFIQSHKHNIRVAHSIQFHMQSLWNFSLQCCSYVGMPYKHGPFSTRIRIRRRTPGRSTSAHKTPKSI